MSNLTTSTDARGGQGTRGVSIADLPLAGTRGRQRAAGTGERFDAHLERALGDGERPESGPERPSDDSAGQTRASDDRARGDDRRVDAIRRDPQARRADRRSDIDHTADRGAVAADADAADAADAGDRADEASERSDEHDVVEAPVAVEPAAPSIAATPADAAATLAVAVLPSLAPIGPETTSPVTTDTSAVSGEAVAEIAGPANSSDAVTIGGTASAGIAVSPLGADPSVASTAAATSATPATSATASDAATPADGGTGAGVVDAADAVAAGSPATGSTVGGADSATGAGTADAVPAAQRAALGATDPNPAEQDIAADPSATGSSTDDSALTVPTEAAMAVGAPAGARVSPASTRDSGAVDGRSSILGAAAGAAGALQTSVAEGDTAGADSDARGRGSDAATTPIATAPAGATPRGSSFDTAVASFDGELATSTQAGDPAAASERSTRASDLLRTPGLDRMSIDLSDEGLGPLTLQAANGVGGLQLRLTAGDRAVGDALAASAHELRRELEASGTLLGSLDVGHRDTPPQGGRDGRAGQGTPWRPDRAEAARPDSPTVRGITPSRSVTAAGGLDLRI